MTGTLTPPISRVARLRLMATTDLHAHLIAHDYYADKPDTAFGLTRVATLIKKARDEAQELGAATLLVDNGDGFQGSMLGESTLLGHAQRHPLTTAFEILKYDAIGLGNHDFNYGLHTLERLLQDVPCPAICSNMSAIEQGLDLPFQPHTIIEKQLPDSADAPPVRIGLLSVLPPQTVIWDAYFLEGRVVVQDMVNAARDTARALRNEGCDLVIALAHTGLGDQDAVLNMENALNPLSDLSDIDAIVAGHTHLALPNTETLLAGRVVMPGAFGSHLGLIDMSLNWDGNRWSLNDTQATLRAVAPDKKTLIAENAELKFALHDDHIEACARLNQPVGHVSAPLHSFFTFFAHDRSLAIGAYAQAAAVRAYVQGTVAADLPLLSAASPGKFGGRSGPSFYTNVPAGEVTMRHVSDLQIFPNRLRAVEVTGTELLDWLEMSAGVFNHITPDSQDQPLLNNRRAGHNYDVIFGIEYEIDLTQPARFNGSGTLVNPTTKRIRNLRWQGAPIRPDQRFLIAVNNYRASGGGHFNMVRNAPQLALPQVRLRDVIRDYIAGHLEQDPLENTPAPWQFTPIGETYVVARTGPAAAAHLDELPFSQLTLLSEDEDGFLGLRIKL